VVLHVYVGNSGEGVEAVFGELVRNYCMRLQRFIKFLIVDSPLGRAQDAWSLYAQLDRLREQIYGPHEFTELVV
jgi:hypothetical protein